MNLNDFINNLPTTTRERSSIIDDTIKQGKIYINYDVNKKSFKLYYLNVQGKKTVKQVKDSDTFRDYLKNNIKLVVLNNNAQQVL